MTNLHRASVCKNVLKELRNNESYVDMHVNTLAIFMYNGDGCSIISVWVPQLNTHVKQYACLCFIRPTIIALDEPSEYIHYYGLYNIMIYPMSTIEMMVFKYDIDHGGYNVLEIFYSKKWIVYKPLKMEKVRTIVPQSYSEIRNLLTILKPIFHVLESYRYMYFMYLLLFKYTYFLIDLNS